MDRYTTLPPYVMMTFPSDDSIPPPFTKNLNEYTPKKRLTYCDKCKYSVETSLVGPQCGKCESYLIVAPR